MKPTSHRALKFINMAFISLVILNVLFRALLAHDASAHIGKIIFGSALVLLLPVLNVVCLPGGYLGPLALYFEPIKGILSWVAIVLNGIFGAALTLAAVLFAKDGMMSAHAGLGALVAAGFFLANAKVIFQGRRRAAPAAVAPPQT